MEYSPPPLFKQGASARAKVVIFAMLAIMLLIVDSRLRSLEPIRKGIGITLLPLQKVALMPRDAMGAVGDYFWTLSSLRKENAQLRQQQVVNAQLQQQGQQLFAENAQLRRLLAAAERVPVKSVLSEILYDTRDPFTRKIVLDRGSQHGVAPGHPVIDDIGVVGQVTRVFPFTSEVTLLTDKDHAISVQVVRSGLRSVAYGRGQSGVLDLRFMATNADIQKGDQLVTSGIDGVYPAGLAVAKVVQVEHKSSDAFARIVCQPSAGIDRNKQLLILLAEASFAPREEPEEVKDKKEKIKKRLGAKDAAKDAKAEQKTGAKPEAKAEPAKAAAAKAEAPKTDIAKPDAPKPGPAPEANAAPKPAPAAAKPAPAVPVAPKPKEAAR
jgi:rod shape-determining protein MreC